MFWAFYWGEPGWLIIPTQWLRTLARKFYRNPQRVKLTGDNGNRSVLIPVTEVLPGKANRQATA